MARMVPPRTADQITSSAERALHQKLRRQLSDEYLVLHSVAWLSRDGSRNMYALRNRLAVSPSIAGLTFHLGRTVAFPDVLVRDEQLGPESPRSRIIDSSDLTTLVKASLPTVAPA